MRMPSRARSALHRTTAQRWQRHQQQMAPDWPWCFRFRFRFRWAGGVICLLAGVMLAACSNPLAPPTPTPPPTAMPTPTASPSPLPSAVPTLTSTVEAATSPVPAPPPSPTPTPVPLPLTLWVGADSPVLDEVRRVAAAYSQQAWVAITVEPRPPLTLRVDLIALQLAGETPPAMVWGDQDVLADLLVDGQLQPVTDFATSNANLGENIVPAARTGATRDGQLWGVPLLLHDFLLLYQNQALAPSPPATSDDLIVLSRLVRESATPEQPNRFGLVSNWTAGRWLLPWLNGAGGAPTTPDGLRPTLNTPEMISALNLLRELQQAAPPELAQFEDGVFRFALGDVAFALDGIWQLEGYQQAAVSEHLTFAPMPRFAATGRVAASTMNSSYLLLPTSLQGEELAAVQGFAAYLASPPVQAAMARNLNRLPATRPALSDPLLQDDPLLRSAATQAEAAQGVPPTRAYRCALEAIDTQLPLIIGGTLPNEEIAAAMQRQADACAVE